MKDTISYIMNYTPADKRIKKNSPKSNDFGEFFANHHDRPAIGFKYESRMASISSSERQTNSIGLNA